MNKKAELLSIQGIVIFILAITLLGLGLTFIRGWMHKQQFNIENGMCERNPEASGCICDEYSYKIGDNCTQPIPDNIKFVWGTNSIEGVVDSTYYCSNEHMGIKLDNSCIKSHEPKCREVCE